MLTQEEKEWIVSGLAWVGLRRWMFGAAAGDAAREWFECQMDLRWPARQGIHLTPLVAGLEADYCRRVCPPALRVPPLIPVTFPEGP